MAVQRFQAHWRDVDDAAMLVKAQQTYTERSKGGLLQLKSADGVHQVKVGELVIEGPEPDWSLRMSGKVEVDGQQRDASFVVTKDKQNDLHFDTVILVGPEGQVPYVWSEESSQWVAQKNPAPKP